MSKETPDTRKHWIPFFPDHFLSELIVLLAIGLALVVAVQFAPYPLEEMANPHDTPMGAKPPWYFYALYQLLKYFPPLLGAVVIPAAAVLVLFALPFIDTRPTRRPRERRVGIAVGILAVVVVVALTYLASLPYGFE